MLLKQFMNVYNVNIEPSESSNSNSDMDDIADDYYDCASPGHWHSNYLISDKYVAVILFCKLDRK